MFRKCFILTLALLITGTSFAVGLGKYTPKASYGYEESRAMLEAKKALFFIGYPRSGHSIIGSILNAHPNTMIAHEIMPGPQFFFSPRSFLKQIWDRATSFEAYPMPGLFQGSYEGEILVVGNKRGMGTSEFVGQDPYSALTQMHRLVSSMHMQLRWIHVQRNPYDNIATMALRLIYPDSASYKQFRKSNNVNSTLKSGIRNKIQHAIKVYFDLSNYGVSFIRNKYSQNELFTLYYEDFIDHPRESIENMCIFLGLDPRPDFLDITSGYINKSTSDTRDSFIWKRELVEKIQEEMKKYLWMERYLDPRYMPSQIVD